MNTSTTARSRSHHPLNPARNGKIARLPRPLREALNHRLDNGQTGRQLIAWLNALPSVQAALAVHFEGAPINEQNLSAWKQGGFADWLRHQEAQEWVGRLVEESDDLETGSGAARLADRVALTVLMELVQVLRHARTLEDMTERRAAVCGVAQQLSRLRHGDHQAERLGLQREQWEMDKEDRLEERKEKEKNAAHGAAIKAEFFPDTDEHCRPLHPARHPGQPSDVAICVAACDILAGELPRIADPAHPGTRAEQEARRILAEWKYPPKKPSTEAPTTAAPQSKSSSLKVAQGHVPEGNQDTDEDETTDQGDDGDGEDDPGTTYITSNHGG